MDLKIKGKYFVVCGASSGFGLSIAETLVAEGANILAIARKMEDLQLLKSKWPEQVDILSLDLTHEDAVQKIEDRISGIKLSGVLVNAGGPPAKSFAETDIQDWDDAYFNLVRWKVLITKRLLPLMKDSEYGRFVYVESASVKQPMDNLVLSTSMRLAVVGFVKTFSKEIAQSKITANILAPGFHETAAMKRLYKKKSENLGITEAEAKVFFEQQIPVGKLGDPNHLASLAVWLFSPYSDSVTGQTFCVDGGFVRSSL